MNKGICWGCIPGAADDLEGRLRAAKDAGYDGVELVVAAPGGADGAAPEVLTLETTEREAGAIRETAARVGVGLPSVMGGGAGALDAGAEPGPGGARRLRREARPDDGAGALARRHRRPAAPRGSSRPETRYDDAWRWTRDALQAVTPHAEQHDVTLAIENVWNKFLLSPQEMRQMIDEVGHPLIGTYFDVGNCILYGYPEQWVGILGSRIKKVHVKDFKRAVATGQGFCQLLDGDANYAAVMRELRSTGYDDYLTSEVSVGNMPDGQGIADTAGRLDRILAM